MAATDPALVPETQDISTLFANEEDIIWSRPSRASSEQARAEALFADESTLDARLTAPLEEHVIGRRLHISRWGREAFRAERSASALAFMLMIAALSGILPVVVSRSRATTSTVHPVRNEPRSSPAMPPTTIRTSSLPTATTAAHTDPRAEPGTLNPEPLTREARATTGSSARPASVGPELVTEDETPRPAAQEVAPIPQLPIVSAPALPVGEEAPRLPLVAPVQMSQATSTPVRGVPDPAERVRAVLAAYERAYSRLDADDVAALWPSVNRAALARAFAGLSHQEVRLERCAVLVDGPAARASCEGTLTWIPKVGGGRSRQQQRTWRFALNLTGETWEIVKAEMR